MLPVQVAAVAVPTNQHVTWVWFLQVREVFLVPLGRHVQNVPLYRRVELLQVNAHLDEVAALRLTCVLEVNL